MDKEWCKRNCPYQPDCIGGMCNYVISMVGELKPQKVKLEERNGFNVDKYFHCPRCNKILSRTYERFDIRFCSNCGQAVEWD